MGVKDVRITPGLNQAIWSRGVKSPPRRIRVRLERKRNDDEGAKEKLYVVASVVEGITSFKVSCCLASFCEGRIGGDNSETWCDGTGPQATRLRKGAQRECVFFSATACVLGADN
jgi:large subunit ribosomal protein L31e